MAEIECVLAARVAAVSAANYAPDPDDPRAGVVPDSGPAAQIRTAFAYIQSQYGYKPGGLISMSSYTT